MAIYIKKDFASPNGPILLLSAEGSTTASIAEANGVLDFSGNGNHGQAYGGVTVLDGGESFSFDGVDDNIKITNTSFVNSIMSLHEMTISLRLSANEGFNNWRPVAFYYNNGTSTGGNQLGCINIYSAGTVAFVDRNQPSGNQVVIVGFTLEANKEHFLAITLDYNLGKAKFYADGVLVAENSEWLTGLKSSVDALSIGGQKNGYQFSGTIRDLRIYPRALSAAEVKYLYNGFQPSLIMGQTIPSGAILDLSARGLTTSGIAQANGVVDRSGNGNHGQAYNGVAVVNDDEMGRCLSNDETGYILFPTSMLSGLTVKQLTMCALIKLNQITSTNGQLIWEVAASNLGCLGQIAISPSGNFRVAGRSSISDAFAKKDSTALAEANKLYFITGIVNYETKQFTLYINGQIVATDNGELVSSGSLPAYAEIHAMGRSRSGSTLGLNGYCTDIHVYTRALTASEVQQLADASLKKIRGVSMGSNLIKHIYYGSNLIYAKTKDYLLPKTFTRTQLSQTALSSPSRAAFISPEGNMFATDWGGKCVKIFDSTGTYVRSFTPLSGKIPYGINGDATYLYVTYWDSPNIYKYQYSGTDVPTLKNTWTTSHQYNNGTDIYNGYLYVTCSYDYVIMKIDVSSGAVTELPSGTSYFFNDLSIDKVNSRIVTTQNGGMNNGTKGHLIIYDMSGTLLVDKEMNGTYASKMDSPQGVVVDAAGYIYLGGAYTSGGSYNQGFMVMDKDLNILYDLTQSECPTFCYTFNYDSYHNRVVWVGTSYGGSSPYIYGIDL